MPFMCVFTQPLRVSPRPACGGETGHPRDLGCQRFGKASQKPLDRVLHAARRRSAISGSAQLRMRLDGVRFKATLLLAGTLLVSLFFGQSKRLQLFGPFTNHPGVGLIFHHCLCAVFRTLVFLETCFGTGAGLVRSGFHYRSLSASCGDKTIDSPVLIRPCGHYIW